MRGAAISDSERPSLLPTSPIDGFLEAFEVARFKATCSPRDIFGGATPSRHPAAFSGTSPLLPAERFCLNRKGGAYSPVERANRMALEPR
jgi:hypothetical protein